MTPEEAIAAATRRNPHLVNRSGVLTPLDVMLAREEGKRGDDDYAARAEGIDDWLGWIFEEGPRLDVAAKRLYVFARAFRPDVIRCMSGAEIAALFRQTRAAESARARRVLDGTMKKAGYRCTTVPFQKSESMRAKARESAKGNRNRAKRAA